MQQVPHQAGLEDIATRRDRRVSREHDASARDQPRLLERHLPRRAQLADALHRAKEAVALVEVEHPRDHPERSQRSYATDAENDLLAESAIWLGHVQAVGDGAKVGRV